MAEQVNNLYLINAPAGSGKTTTIKAKIREIMVNNPLDNILCITYTNRATDELLKDIKDKNVYIGTIHSFMNNFMKRYFAHEEVLNLYFEEYGNAIKARIENTNQDEKIALSNERYIEKNGKLNYATVIKNIAKISYGQSQFSSLYYAKLSHDDLISFSKKIIDKFPIINKRINSKYQYIFIDEYQDTTANVLKIFFESISNSNSKLYLFGDKMQQIYKNYDGSFENQFKSFKLEPLSINYRSVPEIVKLLNKIYNDSNYDQEVSQKMNSEASDFNPRVIFSNDVKKTVENIKPMTPDTLILYLLNKERFSEINALDLFSSYDGMKKYSYEKMYSAVDVLTASHEDNNDELLKLMYTILDMFQKYQDKQYGLIIQCLKKYSSLFEKDSFKIQLHHDKKILYDKLSVIFTLIDNDATTIEELLFQLESTSLIRQDYIESIRADEDYTSALKVPIVQLKNVRTYLDDPKVSTQHGVKGESHDNVLFVADTNAGRPNVRMYEFFKMLEFVEISLDPFQQFYYDYAHELFKLENKIGMKINDLDSKITYPKHEKTIISSVSTIISKFQSNLYFQHLCKNNYEKFQGKNNVTNAKGCLKESTVYGVLSAYKLFYVGCSRARKNLTVLIDNAKVVKINGNIEIQKEKFKQLGFEIIGE